MGPGVGEGRPHFVRFGRFGRRHPGSFLLEVDLAGEDVLHRRFDRGRLRAEVPIEETREILGELHREGWVIREEEGVQWYVSIKKQRETEVQHRLNENTREELREKREQLQRELQAARQRGNDEAIGYLEMEIELVDEALRCT